MRGIILAGGRGTRLLPLTKLTNKHLLPVYDLPMIFYPITTLIYAGITDIIIVTGSESAGDFLELLGDGTQFNAQFTYRVQPEAGGIAEALGLCEDFAGKEPVTVILGDNIFDENLKSQINIGDEFKGAKIFLKSVPAPERFGVASITNNKITQITEKPKEPASNLAVTGLYIYDNQAWNVIRKLKPSGRGELEITDVNNWYIKKGRMKYHIIRGCWMDAGTPDSLLRASNYLQKKRIIKTCRKLPTRNLNLG